MANKFETPEVVIEGKKESFAVTEAKRFLNEGIGQVKLGMMNPEEFTSSAKQHVEMLIKELQVGSQEESFAVTEAKRFLNEGVAQIKLGMNNIEEFTTLSKQHVEMLIAEIERKG